jgi:hypothetical protein
LNSILLYTLTVNWRELEVMKGTKTVLVAGCILLSCAGVKASPAMQVSDLAKVSHDITTNAQNVACGPYRCGRRPSSYYYAPVVVIPRVYYGGCAPGWVGCWAYPYGGWYRPPGSEGYYGWPYY